MHNHTDTVNILQYCIFNIQSNQILYILVVALLCFSSFTRFLGFQQLILFIYFFSFGLFCFDDKIACGYFRYVINRFRGRERERVKRVPRQLYIIWSFGIWNMENFWASNDGSCYSINETLSKCVAIKWIFYKIWHLICLLKLNCMKDSLLLKALSVEIVFLISLEK